MQTHKAVHSERKQLEKVTAEKAHMEEELASLTADLEAFDEEIDQLRAMLEEEEQTLVSAQQRQVWKPTNPLTYACVL
jgi:septal ring factor EnvC (AmiA/AmiB activator)